MKEKSYLKSGFTIVELLIVIIVIAILATIVITAYNGVQTRAKNTKTVSAVEAWAKAVRFYEIQEGDMPDQFTCLGNSDTYPSGECEPGNEVWSDIEDFKPYFGNGDFPEPDTTKITNPEDSSDFRSGAVLGSGDGEAYIWYVQLNTHDCPKIGSLDETWVNFTWGDNVQCTGYMSS
jgi:prepilin-type N-terminal cleavage/methylation domain-containing protein